MTGRTEQARLDAVRELKGERIRLAVQIARLDQEIARLRGQGARGRNLGSAGSRGSRGPQT